MMEMNSWNRKFMLVIVSLGSFSTDVLSDRQWSYSYNAQGQIETLDGPRVDVSDLTINTYDSLGRLIRVTNALGHSVHYQNYDANGRAGKVVDANGIEALVTYHSRGWVTSSSIIDPSGNGALNATTHYEYDVFGQVTKTTFPDGRFLKYQYDDAQRLIGIENSLGEHIDYDLDPAGNRVAELYKDGAGQVVKSSTQAYDEMSRLMDVRGAASQLTHFDYDSGGNNTQTIDGNTHATGRTYDLFDRLTAVVDAEEGEARYEYDAEGRILKVVDQRGLITSYSYDAYGNVLTVDSPDTGLRSNTYDSAGNLLTTTFAGGLVKQYSYDALNRLKTVSFPSDASRNISYRYDQLSSSYGVGRLTEIEDSSGLTRFNYDHRGNVVERLSIRGSNTYLTAYTYDLADRRTQVTYPSGRIVNYGRDLDGRIARVDMQRNSAADLLVVSNQATYLPFGPMTAFEFGNQLQLAREYDQDYRVNTRVLTADVPIEDKRYVYDGVDNILQIFDGLNTIDDQVFAYDRLNRLTDANGGFGDFLFSYDAVGNRAQAVFNVNSLVSIEDYTYEATSNRLQSVDSGTSIRLFNYDEFGNIILDDRGSDEGVVSVYDAALRLSTVTSEEEG